MFFKLKSVSYAKFRNKGAPTPSLKPPPANYVCHRCNQKGHWIKFCPTNGVSIIMMYYIGCCSNINLKNLKYEYF